MSPTISVVIPTMNEEGSIGATVQSCRTALEGIEHEIIIVDNSHDNTPTEAIRAGAKVIKQIGPAGYGAALLQGFYWTKGKYVVFFDGDGTYDPGEVSKLVEPLLKDEADLVNGNRFFNMEKNAMSLGNRIGNVLLTWIGNLLFHMSIKDSQSGMKAFRRDMLMRVTLWERDFPFASEILAEASKVGMRLTEVGISYRRRVGKSKLNPTVTGMKILWASVKMLRDYDPLFLFLEIGLVLEAVGFVVVWPTLSAYVQYGTFMYPGRALAAVFCWLAGLLCIFTGIILNAFNYATKKIEARLGGQQ